jgi:PKD repeat protein
MRLSTLLGAASVASLFPLGFASAQGLAAFGPVSPDNGFPEWYSDNNGLQLDLCLADPALCVLPGAVTLTNPGAPFPDNYGGTFPDEASNYWGCGATIPTNNGGQAMLFIGLEARFFDDVLVPGEQIVFARIRIRIDNLVAGANYTVTTPGGIFNFVATGSGVRGINFTDDVGRVVIGDFAAPLAGPVGPFFTWDTDLPILDAQGREYIGDPGIDHTITGGLGGINFFRVQGQSVGGPGVNSIETNLFSVMGLKSLPATPEPPVAAFNSAPNSGTAPLLVSFTDTSTGVITSHSWNFGDASTSTLQNPTHSYGAGLFSVSLTVTGPGGSNTLTKPGLIAVAPPAGGGGELTLANPVPGTAGVPNTLTVTGCTPSRVVGVYTGLVLGASIVNQGACGGIPIGLGSPFRLAGKARANAAGVAVVPVSPPATTAGRTFHFQAVEPFSCRTSNIVSDVL